MLPTFTEDAAEMLLAGLRWRPEGYPICPSCGAAEPYRLATRRKFNCRCGRQFSVTSDTVFAYCKLTLNQCVQALWVWEETEGKITATALAAALGVTYTTARILRIRLFEATMQGGSLSERSWLARGYWQGFNFFTFDEITGEIVRQNKHGERRSAF